MNDLLSGERFGDWTVIGPAGSVVVGRDRIKRKNASLCECRCGTRRQVLNNNLKRGLSHNCGCVRKQGMSVRFGVHGAAKAALGGSRAGSIWLGIIKRCTDPRSCSYPDYGGRGIKLCDRWNGPDGFKHFLSDMGEPPTDQHSIGRKDNDGPYAPTNCRWELPLEQAANTRANKHGWLNGERLIQAEIARREGVSATCIRGRMAKGMYTRP